MLLRKITFNKIFACILISIIAIFVLRPNAYGQTDAPESCGDLVKEVETGIAYGRMTVTDDAQASNGRAVFASGEQPIEVAVVGEDRVDLCVTIVQAGIYQLNGRVLAPSDQANSAYISLDGNHAAGLFWEMGVSETYIAQTISNSIDLTAGNHTLSIFQLESGVFFDVVEFVLLTPAPVEEVVTPTLELPTETPTELPTATPTELPTELPTETPLLPTQTAVPIYNHDAYEPNNSFETASTILIGEKISDLTLDPAQDSDYFKIYLKTGQIIDTNTLPFGGIDTKMSIFSINQELIASNDDRSVTDTGSRVGWQAAADGWYVILIESAIPIANGSYQLQTSLELPTPTPTLPATSTPGPTSTPAPTSTPVPTATPIQKLDIGEPNNYPEDAFGIIPGEVYAMTLGPVGYDSHDFFYLLGKVGVSYTCEAINIQGVDPTIRVYIGEVGAGILIAENDDISSSDIGSRVHFNITGVDTGVYIVVEDRIGSGSYDFSCYAQPTPVWTMPAASSGSTPVEAAPVVEATAEGTEDGSIEEGGEGTEIVESQPVARLVPLNFTESNVQAISEEPVLTTIEIVISYDQNNNRESDPDEGIPNVSIRALDGNDPIGWAVTNEQGRATMTLTRPVDSVLVPYLSGWTYKVRMGQLNQVELQVPAQKLPVIMPILATEQDE